jgi:hypothetical protein
LLSLKMAPVYLVPFFILKISKYKEDSNGRTK